MPAISVVLPVYNGAEYLSESVASILAQTVDDFELIIVDDCSQDDSPQVIGGFRDSRIITLRNDVNLGLPASLNIGIAAARGDLIARQDQDDISAVDRFAVQLDVLERHPDVGLVGTWAAILQSSGGDDWRTTGHHRHPSDDSTLRWRLLWNSPFVHSSVLMRRSVLSEVGGYPTDVDELIPEDYDLWSRMARSTRMANVPRVLQCYRETPGGLSRTRADAIAKGVQRISVANLAEATNCDPTDSRVVDLARTLNGRPPIHKGARPWISRVHLLRQAARSIPDFTGPVAWRELAQAQARTAVNSLIDRATR